MAQTPEGIIKDQIKADCALILAEPTMPMGTGYGSSGVSDFIINWMGLAVFIEAKAGKPQPTTLQLDYLQDQWQAGAIVGCVGGKALKTTGRGGPLLGWIACKKLNEVFMSTTGLQYGGMAILTANVMTATTASGEQSGHTFATLMRSYAILAHVDAMGLN